MNALDSFTANSQIPLPLLLHWTWAVCTALGTLTLDICTSTAVFDVNELIVTSSHTRIVAPTVALSRYTDGDRMNPALCPPTGSVVANESETEVNENAGELTTTWPPTIPLAA